MADQYNFPSNFTGASGPVPEHPYMDHQRTSSREYHDASQGDLQTPRPRGVSPFRSMTSSPGVFDTPQVVMRREPRIQPQFVDELAKQMELEEGQRMNLHDFVQVCILLVFISFACSSSCLL